MSFFWIVAIIVVVWWLASRSKKVESRPLPVEADKANLDVEPETIITEEDIFKAQSWFDKKLQEEINFPDAIEGYPIYIYKNLVTVWYKKLAAENRYDDKMTQKLRSDFLDYIRAMQHRASSGYLFTDSPDKEVSSRHGEKMATANKKAVAIEDAFAAAIGDEAIAELKHFRNIKADFSKFDKYGNLAPKGFEYDDEGELQPRKKSE